MNVVKSKEIVFSVKKKKHFSKYINIKTEMNLCSGKTANLKDSFPIERGCGLNAQLYKAKMKYICGPCFMQKK